LALGCLMCARVARALPRHSALNRRAELARLATCSCWPTQALSASGTRVFEGVGPARLELVATTPYHSGVVCLRYQPRRRRGCL